MRLCLHLVFFKKFNEISEDSTRTQMITLLVEANHPHFSIFNDQNSFGALYPRHASLLIRVCHEAFFLWQLRFQL